MQGQTNEGGSSQFPHSESLFESECGGTVSAAVFAQGIVKFVLRVQARREQE